jgi:hypothetical protein
MNMKQVASQLLGEYSLHCNGVALAVLRDDLPYPFILEVRMAIDNVIDFEFLNDL